MKPHHSRIDENDEKPACVDLWRLAKDASRRDFVHVLILNDENLEVTLYQGRKSRCSGEQRLSTFFRQKNLSFFWSNDVYTTTFAVEEYATIDEGEDRVITTHAYTFTRLELSTTLTDDDVARNDCLSTKLLYAEALAAGVASVTYGTLTFFMCHNLGIYW